MVARVSRRDLAHAVARHLLGVDDAVGYYGQVGWPLPDAPPDTPTDPPAKSPKDPRVAAYFVLYPGAGGQGPDPDAADQAIDLTMPFDITAAGGDREDVLALIDRLDAHLLSWTPDIGRDDVHVGYIRRPPGVPQNVPVLLDTQFQPVRHYARLQYQLTATT